MKDDFYRTPFWVSQPKTNYLWVMLVRIKKNPSGVVSILIIDKCKRGLPSSKNYWKSESTKSLHEEVSEQRKVQKVYLKSFHKCIEFRRMLNKCHSLRSFIVILYYLL